MAVEPDEAKDIYIFLLLHQSPEPAKYFTGSEAFDNAVTAEI